MMRQIYLPAVDQGTRGIKGMLFDTEGKSTVRCDRFHVQRVDDKGWVGHDLEEIYRNTIAVVHNVVERAGIDKNQVTVVGISNRRETAVVRDRESGELVYDVIVWQCACGEPACEKIRATGYAEQVREGTGLPLSSHLLAVKIAWVSRNISGAEERARARGICYGTVDNRLLYHLTGGKTYATDYSNASRMQLFNIRALSRDPELYILFGIPLDCMAQIRGSDEWYGDTDFEGFFDHSLPILAVLGDSYGALFGQDCREPGLVKATYSTGSSVMLNTGDDLIVSQSGLVTSFVWCVYGKVQYVLEGSINYTGLVISQLKSDLQLVQTMQQAHELITTANPLDQTYFIPTFTGLGAPYWDSTATGLFTDVIRLTGRTKVIRAGVDCTTHQVADTVNLIREESGLAIRELWVNGGPTESGCLVWRQNGILGIPVCVPQWQELSGMGAAHAAGISMGIYDQTAIFSCMERTAYEHRMPTGWSEELYQGWKHAIQTILNRRQRTNGKFGVLWSLLRQAGKEHGKPRIYYKDWEETKWSTQGN